MREGENRFKAARTKYNQHGNQAVRDVAKATGITKSLIDDLESQSGKLRNVSYLTVAKLAKYYDVSTDYLAGITEHPTADQSIREICEYTGLSVESVELLHLINETPETDFDDTTKINRSNIRLINMVLEDAAKRKSSPSGLPLLETLFSYLYRYISASNSEFSTRLIESYMNTHLPKDSEEYNDYQTQIELSKKLSTIVFGDLLYTASVRELSRPLIMKDIEKHLKHLSDLYDSSHEKKGALQ